MTIEKPFYLEPKDGRDPAVSDVAQVTPSQYEYILQRYEDYIKNDGKLDFKSYVIEFFDKDFKFKKGGVVK